MMIQFLTNLGRLLYLTVLGMVDWSDLQVTEEKRDTHDIDDYEVDLSDSQVTEEQSCSHDVGTQTPQRNRVTFTDVVQDDFVPEFLWSDKDLREARLPCARLKMSRIPTLAGAPLARHGSWHRPVPSGKL